MNIPEESIEKAAAAIYELDDEYTPYLVARAALSAAAPTLMAMALREAATDIYVTFMRGQTLGKPADQWLEDRANELEQS